LTLQSVEPDAAGVARMRMKESSNRSAWKDLRKVSEESPEEVARSYESATARLEEIIHRLDSGEAQLRETLELCEEAKGLIEYCAAELAAVDQGLKELRLEDLARSLAVPGNADAPEAPEPSAPGTDAPPAADQPDVPF
jgi:exodeoxyribonuclease VII small subunit